MISKLTGYEDLFAYDAKYHKRCYSHYISQRNIKSHLRMVQDKPVLDDCKQSPQPSRSSSDSNEDALASQELSESQILHRAAALLRNAMATCDTNTFGFPTPEGINKEEFKKQVPKMLLKFISWLIDEKLFTEVSPSTSHSIHIVIIVNI